MIIWQVGICLRLGCMGLGVLGDCREAVGEAAGTGIVKTCANCVGPGNDGHEGVQEAGAAVQMRRPYTPTQMDIDEHMPTHLQFRAWCPHCVAWRAVSGHHIASNKDDRMGVAISMFLVF